MAKAQNEWHVIYMQYIMNKLQTKDKIKMKGQ